MDFKLEKLNAESLLSWSYSTTFSPGKKKNRMCKGVSYVLHNVASLPFRFLHFGVHLAVSPCLFVSLSLCFADDTLLWQVSLRFLSLRSVLSVSLLISVCLPLSLVSLQFDITVLTLCRSASPCLSVCPFLCLSLCLLLAWCFSDATEVVWTAITLFLYLYWLSFSPLLMFFHQSGAGSEKAVHLDIAGDGHHVPVNTRPLAMLSHLVSSCLFCYSLLIFLKY